MQIKESELELFDSVESLIEKIRSQPIDADVHVIVLKTDNKTLQSNEKSYNLTLCGKTMLEWTKSAFQNCEVAEVECDKNASILSVVGPFLSNKKWTAIFYADTPLLRRKTFLSILDYAQVKCLDALKFERGYVFNTNFLKNAKNLENITTQKFGEEDFFGVFNLVQLGQATNVLKNRILAFHKQNGVQILDDATTFVDADVTIAPNVVLYPNVCLLKNTEIGEGTQILPFSTIINSKVGKNCKIESAFLENAKLKDETKVQAFEKIVGEKEK